MKRDLPFIPCFVFKVNILKYSFFHDAAGRCTQMSVYLYDKHLGALTLFCSSAAELQ